MALIDLQRKLIILKVVYAGPTLGGKTTNLRVLHGMLPEMRGRELEMIAGPDERTRFHDRMPLDLGDIDGVRVGVTLYTVPGQEELANRRRAVLAGADGIVFVADSDIVRLGENVTAVRELERLLGANASNGPKTPVVIQYNKRDLAAAADINDLEAVLNTRHWPAFPATVVQQVGVVETARTICTLALRNL